jgi:hypothetical protein
MKYLWKLAQAKLERAMSDRSKLETTNTPAFWNNTPVFAWVP